MKLDAGGDAEVMLEVMLEVTPEVDARGSSVQVDA